MVSVASPLPARAEDSMGAIKIGIDIPMTGSFADSIKPVQNSDELWARDINARGGLLGRKVELTFIDNKSSTETGVSIYQRLLQGGYDFVFEDGGSALVQRESTLAEQYKKLLIVPAGFAKALYDRGYKYLFFSGNSLSDNVSIGFTKMLETMPPVQRPKTIGYATLQNIAFTSLTRGMQERSKAIDLKTVLNLTYPPSINDATPLISDMQQAKPDVVFQSGMSNDTVMFVRAAKEQGLHDRLMVVSYTAAALPNFLDIVGDAADLVIYATGWEPEVRNEKNFAFVAAYQKAYGVRPTYDAANGYARWEILEAAVNATKSLDQTVLRDYIASHGFETVNGALKFGQNGYVTPDDTLVVQFQHGKRVIVWPKEQANGTLVLPILQ
jgi:branched-chain amino acid transport system substrate-binding protein